MSKVISADALTAEVTKICMAYTDEAIESTKDAVRDVAKEAKGQLKVEGKFKNRTGDYRKGWRIKFTNKRLFLEATIHNKHYQLTHLLESGHAKFLWGRPTGDYVQAFPHIEKVNQEAQEELEREIKRRLQ